MARVVIDVMLKPEILDPQGQAVQRALQRLGFSSITGVRQGKRFELDLDDAALGARDPAEVAEQMAATLLANPVIEDFSVRMER